MKEFSPAFQASPMHSAMALPEPSPPEAGPPVGDDLPVITVAAGVIRDAVGRILIAKRLARTHQGGLWEFPGGKLEAGETGEQALRRELREELDIEVVEASPLIDIRHCYPDRQVQLKVWRVERFRGDPRGLQGQPLRWVAADRLPGYEFPAANRPIVAAARLPDHYAILDMQSGDPEAMRERLGRFVGLGLGWVRLRGNRLEARDYAVLARRAAEYCRTAGIRLLLGGEPDLVRRTGAAGLHLRSEQLPTLRRRPLASGYWLAASCHDRAELRQAERIGADFAVLGPVRATATHPEARPLGWERFAALAEEAAIPVFALGGLRPADTAEAKRRGAQGIAAIRGFLDDVVP